MGELKTCAVKLIDANALKRNIERKYMPSDTISAGMLYDLISTAPEVNRRAEPENKPLTWISVDEKLPEPETRVLVCAETRCGDKTYRHITAGMYEDGNIWREDSSWNFNDFDNLDTYDEEQDDYKIPKGWWEYTIYNSDEGNYPIDDFVTHWMPLPQPPKEEK